MTAGPFAGMPLMYEIAEGIAYRPLVQYTRTHPPVAHANGPKRGGLRHEQPGIRHLRGRDAAHHVWFANLNDAARPERHRFWDRVGLRGRLRPLPLLLGNIFNQAWFAVLGKIVAACGFIAALAFVLIRNGVLGIR